MDRSKKKQRTIPLILLMISVFVSISGFSCINKSMEHDVISNIISATSTLKTFKLDTTLTLKNTIQGKTNSQPYSNQWQWKSQKLVDLMKNKLFVSMQSGDIANNTVTPYVWDMYVVDDCEYIKTISPEPLPIGSEAWNKTKLLENNSLIDNEAQVIPLVELLKTASQVILLGLEKIDNIECYIIHITPSREAITSWVISQQQPTGLSLWERGITPTEADNGYEKGYQASWIRFWIEKDSNLIKKAEINALFSYQGIKDFQGQMNFSDYNKTISIEVPTEALNTQENPS